MFYRGLAMVNVEVNTQQILNMGSQVEKLQHRMQHLPTTTADQLEAERAKLDEMKRVEIQDVEQTNEDHPVNPDAGGNNPRLPKNRKSPAETPEVAENASEPIKELPHHGHQINLIV